MAFSNSTIAAKLPLTSISLVFLSTKHPH